MAQYNTQYHETNPLPTAPLHPLPNSINLTQNLALFGITFAFVYGASYTILAMMARTMAMPSYKRDAMLSIAPILLATPYWTGVLCLMGVYPFTESVFWALTVWSLFIDGFVLLATLVYLVAVRGGGRTCGDEESGEEDIEALARILEKELMMDLEEALAAASSPPEYCDVEPAGQKESNPRTGSVTKIWLDAVGAHGVYSDI